jgi:DNA replication protein DnaC
LSEGKVCRKCNGTGWLLVQKDGETSATRCECRLASEAHRLLAEARIPKRYNHCEFENFEEGHDESLVSAIRKARRFVEDFPIQKHGILFLGPCGVGKTHLAIAIIKRLIREKRVRCLFYDFRELLKEIQNSYNAVSGTSEMSVLEPVLTSEMLVLDDLGAEKSSEWVGDTLSYIINHRYNNELATIITSNFPEERKKPGEEILAERIGTRLRSRLFEMCTTICIDAPDYREHKAYSVGIPADKRRKKSL